MKSGASVDGIVGVLRAKRDDATLLGERLPSACVAERLFDVGDNRDDDELFGNLASHRARVAIWNRYSLLSRRNMPARFLHLCDLHVPFHDIDVLEEAVAYALSSGIAHCVVNGDLLDVYAASKFAKNKSVDIRKEIECASRVLEVLSAHFDTVILVEGNHERRIKRYVAASIDPDLQWLFRVDLLGMLAERHENVLYAGGPWCKVGSVVFAHPDAYSKVPGRTAIGIADSLRARGETVSAVIIGHTHKVVNGMLANGMAIYEAGCACREMDYVGVGRSPISPWTCGYGVIALDGRGDIDVNESRVYVSCSQPVSVIS